MKQETKQESLQNFHSYWKARYPRLTDQHWDWLLQHSTVRYYESGTILSQPDDGQSALYIPIGRAVLVRERYCDHCDRNIILNIALPHMGLFTTMHFYSNSPSLGSIAVLHAGWVIRIPYQHIQLSREQERAIDMLIDRMLNKKKHQTDHLRVMDNTPTMVAKYFYFASHLPLLCNQLSQRDQARLLHTSRSSIQRAKKLYLRLK